jgi:hypothetical protein
MSSSHIEFKKGSNLNFFIFSIDTKFDFYILWDTYHQKFRFTKQQNSFTFFDLYEWENILAYFKKKKITTNLNEFDEEARNVIAEAVANKV